MKTHPLLYFRFWKNTGWILVWIVTILSLVPTPRQPVTFELNDKLAHLIAYSVLMFWFGAIYPSRNIRLKTGLALVLMGIILEFAQGLTGYREFQFLDMAANAMGVLLGFVLCHTPLSGAFVFIEKRFLPGE
jgi:VanZ family protein